MAFQLGDRNRPVVLGSLWSDKNKLPPKAATETLFGMVGLAGGRNRRVFFGVC